MDISDDIIKVVINSEIPILLNRAATKKKDKTFKLWKWYGTDTLNLVIIVIFWLDLWQKWLLQKMQPISKDKNGSYIIILVAKSYLVKDAEFMKIFQKLFNFGEKCIKCKKSKLKLVGFSPGSSFKATLAIGIKVTEDKVWYHGNDGTGYSARLWFYSREKL